MSDIAKIIGQRIRNYRTQKGLSQEKLAELAGCHPTYIGQLERGEKNATLESVEHKYDVSLLKDLIREHVEATGSPRGKEILENFGEYLPKFKKVLPHDYDKMLRLIAKMEEKGEDSEQAQIEAFYAMKSAK